MNARTVKRWYRRLTAAGVTALLTLSSLNAGGPAYSRYGIGDLTVPVGSSGFAMGLASLAVPGEGINMLNPAALHTIARTRFSAGFEYAYFSSSSADVTSGYSRGDFQGLAVAFPIDTARGAVLMAGASPYSRVLYAIEWTEAVAGTNVTQLFRGTGGLSTLSLGGSYRLHRSVVAGASLQYLFGRIRQVNQVDFADALFSDSNIERSWFHSGAFLSAGLIVRQVGSLLGIASLAPLDVGVLYSSPSALDVREERLVTSSSFVDTSVVRAGTTRIPSRLGIGAAYSMSERFLFAGDVVWQGWRTANFFSQGDVQMIRDSWRVGAGIEIRPPRDRSAFGDRIFYRVGASYAATYLKLSGQPIDEVMVTGGLGIPIGPLALMNVGLQIGRRGTTAAALQQDTFLRFSLSISGGEEWFMDMIDD